MGKWLDYYDEAKGLDNDIEEYLKKMACPTETIELGKIIKDRREKMGIKICDLAMKIGISAVYITQIEKHNKLPSPMIIKKIESEIGIPLMDVYKAEKVKNLLEEIDKELLCEEQ